MLSKLIVKDSDMIINNVNLVSLVTRLILSCSVLKRKAIKHLWASCVLKCVIGKILSIRTDRMKVQVE